MRFFTLLFGCVCALKVPDVLSNVRGSHLGPTSVKIDEVKPELPSPTKTKNKIKRRIVEAIRRRIGISKPVLLATTEDVPLPAYPLTKRIIQLQPANTTQVDSRRCPHYATLQTLASDEIEPLARCAEQDPELVKSLRKTWEGHEAGLVDAVAAELNLHPTLGLCLLLNSLTSTLTPQVVGDLLYCRTMYKEVPDIRSLLKLGPPLEFKTAT